MSSEQTFNVTRRCYYALVGVQMAPRQYYYKFFYRNVQVEVRTLQKYLQMIKAARCIFS